MMLHTRGSTSRPRARPAAYRRARPNFPLATLVLLLLVACERDLLTDAAPTEALRPRSEMRYPATEGAYESTLSFSTTSSMVVSGKKALLYHSDGDIQAMELGNALVATGLFAAGDVQRAAMPATPMPLANLQAFDCVIAWTNVGPPNPVAQGDRLREYVDAGGRVVLAVYGYSSPTNPWEMQGGIMGNGYSPLDITTSALTTFPRSLNFGTALTSHYLLQGVSDFTYGGNVNYVAPSLDPGATLVGRDNFGVPLIAQNAAGNVVGINLYPTPISFAKSPGVYRTIANACIGSTNTAPTASAGGPYTGAEGSPVSLKLSGSDADGDALTYTWDLGDGTTGSGPAPPASHTYGDNAVYTISLRALDTSGEAGYATTTATIANVAPSVGAISAPISPVALGGSVSINAGVTDPGSLDTHGAAIDWGDATTTAIPVGSATSPISSTHVYTDPGVYRIRVTVTDDDGGTDDSVFEYVVVYDPSAGFATGGGWIDSPSGAYSADPLLIGRANFGFVSKYQKGKTTPSGETQFQFHTGNLNFHSNVYEWLVVAGARGQFKGWGTVNGAGDYGFILTVTDGHVAGGGGVDRFRIKIWERASGNIVYDNQTGAADDAAVTTALGAGSIVIHSK